MNNPAMKSSKIVKPIFCPNASRIGYNRYEVKHGDLIRFHVLANDDSKIYFLGRVLGCAVESGTGEKYGAKPLGSFSFQYKARSVLLVLKASDDLSFGYPFHVPIEKVEQVFSPGTFTHFFLFGHMPNNVEDIVYLSELGSLSNSYLADYLNDDGSSLKADVKAVWQNKLKETK